MKKRQITIKDIAKALHISPSTVSRSLADHPDISQETKNIVNAYAREHKYKPNALALSLRTNNTKTIGVILPQIVHYFFSSVLSGIEDEAEKGGYRVIICQSNENYEKEVKGAQALLEARVCGVLASVAKTTTIYNHFQELIDSDIPMVFFDRICTGILTDRVVVDDYTEALRLTPELLSLPNRPDAFFAVNDETAIGVLNVVKAKGLRIPDEVSICGFTNNSLAEVSDPLLTSVDQHGYELGAIAMRLLIERLNGVRDGDRIVSKIIKTNLVVRQSTR